VDEVARAHRKTVLGQDDVIDALAGAVTARLGASGLKTLPATPERDGRGLRMEIVYAG
jgi:predicted RNase H-like nuclease